MSCLNKSIYQNAPFGVFHYNLSWQNYRHSTINVKFKNGQTWQKNGSKKL